MTAEVRIWKGVAYWSVLSRYLLGEKLKKTDQLMFFRELTSIYCERFTVYCVGKL